ncbi:MAG TPA: four helix bundle protein [Candidatus Paceibacterota bacterium]
MNTQIQNSKPKYDLEDRTAKFGENIIDFARFVKPDYINKPIITRLIRLGTSIGVNYMEASGAESKKDFLHKMSICKKESKESMHFLRMVAKSNL